jgi:hypothetical protein
VAGTKLPVPFYLVFEGWSPQICVSFPSEILDVCCHCVLPESVNTLSTPVGIQPEVYAFFGAFILLSELHLSSEVYARLEGKIEESDLECTNPNIIQGILDAL